METLEIIDETVLKATIVKMLLTFLLNCLKFTHEMFLESAFLQ